MICEERAWQDTELPKIERQKMTKVLNSLDESQKEKFINGSPWIGMKASTLQAMWGNTPKKTQKKLTEEGQRELQFYELRSGTWKTGIKSKFYKVTILDGKVKELQELDPNYGSLDDI